jgi:zinc finger protein BrlA
MPEEYIPMTEAGLDSIPVFLDHNMLFPSNAGRTLSNGSMVEYSNLNGYDDSAYESFEAQHGIRGGPSGVDLDLYSQMSGLISSPSLSMNFMLPSQQQTFADAYEVNSPLREMRAPNAGTSHTPGSMMHAPNHDGKFSILASHSPRSDPSRSRPSATRMPALQSVQGTMELMPPRADEYGMRLLRKQRTRRGSSLLPAVPSHIRVQNKAIKRCEWPRCNKRFQRQEHLKRHEKTHVSSHKYECEFCSKPFGRTDNLKSHTKLHMSPSKKSSRTKYHPEAKAVYEAMCRKPRKSRDSSIGALKPETDATGEELSPRARSASY